MGRPNKMTNINK